MASAAGCSFGKTSLLPSIEDTLKEAGARGTVLGSTRRDEEWTGLAVNVGALFACGATLDLSGVFPGPVPAVALPSYAWDHVAFWPEQSSAIAKSALASPVPSSGDSS